MRIIYSFNKKGYEGECVARELAAASTEALTIIPFNHVAYLDPHSYFEAIRLDRLYRGRHPGLMRMYRDFQEAINESHADAIVVDNCPPYHPEFLRQLNVYKVLYSTDDNLNTYTLNIPYLHAYHHVVYANPAFSAELSMQEKMRYCGMENADWVPLGVFDFECDPQQSEASILSHERDIDVVYVGAFYREKCELLARLKRAFGRRFRVHGFFRLKHNVYLNVRYGVASWIGPITMQARTALYQRSKIGINIQLNEFILANQRLYHLPANGVMQVCDNPALLADGAVFKPGTEILTYERFDDLVETVRDCLANDTRRNAIALAGFRRAKRDYTRRTLTLRIGELIAQGMERIRYVRGMSTSPLDIGRVVYGMPQNSL